MHTVPDRPPDTGQAATPIDPAARAVPVGPTPAPAPTPTPTDAAAFGSWARPSLIAMNRLARRLAPHTDPDDIVQDALARAWRKRAQFDPARGTPTTWLLAIVADRARSSRRSRIRWLRVIDDEAELPDTVTSEPTPDVDLDLDRAIARLSARQQLAVHLHYFLAMTVTETAHVMDCSPGTVKSTLFDARGRLRTLLGDDDD